MYWKRFHIVIIMNLLILDSSKERCLVLRTKGGCSYNMELWYEKWSNFINTRVLPWPYLIWIVVLIYEYITITPKRWEWDITSAKSLRWFKMHWFFESIVKYLNHKDFVVMIEPRELCCMIKVFNECFCFVLMMNCYM